MLPDLADVVFSMHHPALAVSKPGDSRAPVRFVGRTLRCRSYASPRKMLSERILERSSPLSHFLPTTSSLFRIQGSNRWRNPMDTAVVEQLLDEMLAALEELETKATATLQYLKDKGHATDEDLAPYFEQAGNASNVRWRAARLRMMSLVSSALKGADVHKEKSQPSG